MHLNPSFTCASPHKHILRTYRWLHTYFAGGIECATEAMFMWRQYNSRDQKVGVSLRLDKKVNGDLHYFAGHVGRPSPGSGRRLQWTGQRQPMLHLDISLFAPKRGSVMILQVTSTASHTRLFYVRTKDRLSRTDASTLQQQVAIFLKGSTPARGDHGQLCACVLAIQSQGLAFCCSIDYLDYLWL